MIELLCLVPFTAGLLAFLPLAPAARRALLVGTACLHAGLTAALLAGPPDGGTWLAADALGRLFLGITSLVFGVAAIYAAGSEDSGNGVFTGCMLLFLASMTVVCLSRHLTLLWVAVEATTLASAPLIYFHHHRRALEATWKYLLVCSVGIGLALLGNFVLVLALPEPPSLVLDHLLGLQDANPAWLKLGTILLLVGYGTKMGLAPMHTWLPDTHSESPSVVSALLSGALLNCAFLAILRVTQVCVGAGLGDFAHRLLVGFGLFSMLVAALFLVRSRDYKRMLAYSSVEHMGILSLGVGLGGVGVFGALFHALAHSLSKAAMFMAAGNLLEGYGTRTIRRVQGVSHRLPLTGAVWLGGFLALSGTPPFAPFFSELIILKACLDQGGGLAAAYLVVLGIAFLGMSRAVVMMCLGPRGPQTREGWVRVLPPLTLLALALGLGLWLPAPVADGLHQAAELLR